jgi:hypothetical protein
VTIPSILGKTKSNVWGDLLGTGFREFESPEGINGLYMILEGGLHLLAVLARNPGTGQFRRFISKAKEEFRFISVEEIMSPTMNAILERYGFVQEDESWVWRKAS